MPLRCPQRPGLALTVPPTSPYLPLPFPPPPHAHTASPPPCSHGTSQVTTSSRTVGAMPRQTSTLQSLKEEELIASMTRDPEASKPALAHKELHSGIVVQVGRDVGLNCGSGGSVRGGGGGARAALS